MKIKTISQKAARCLDQKLFTAGFTLDQLVELAGLSVASAINSHFSNSVFKNNRVLIISGPGNNGNDGIVAARHLLSFNKFTPEIFLFKEPKSDIQKNLIKQCKFMGIKFLSEFPSSDQIQKYAFVVDAIFGFGFHGNILEPFVSVIKTIKLSKMPVVSVDVPSGWDVDNGPKIEDELIINPEVLVSLTSPKKCSEHFKGAHYLGSRFVPKNLIEEFKLSQLEYKGEEQFLRIN